MSSGIQVLEGAGCKNTVVTESKLDLPVLFAKALVRLIGVAAVVRP